jgi:MFS family permease
MWYLASMLMQIPAGMIADKWWQKNWLIISKFFLLISSLLFLFAEAKWMFFIGAICMSLGNDAFNAGIWKVFLKKSLELLGRGSEFRKVSSKISGDVALASIVFIVLLPLLTPIDYRLPILVGLILDMVWLLTVLSLVEVPVEREVTTRKNIFLLLREIRWRGFLSYSLFSGVISGFLFADNAYRSPYLVELGYPLMYIGLVMWWSRLVWWFVGRNIHHIEKRISFRTLVLLEIIIFPLYYIFAWYISNPWFLGVIFSLVVGWFWWRSEIYTDELMNRIHDDNYRSTLLSLKPQITNIVQVIIAFGIAWVMGISYALGFQVLGIVMFILLSGIYFFGMRKTW